MNFGSCAALSVRRKEFYDYIQFVLLNENTDELPDSQRQRIGVLIFGFRCACNRFASKCRLPEYLADLRCTRMRTLANLIAFNKEHCRQEMPYFGQEVFEAAEETSGDLRDPDYLAARALCLRLTREEGIDAALKRDHLDAIVAPSFSFGSSVAAVAGYPSISVPVGLTPEGKPAGIWMYAGFLQEPRLLAFAYALEQELEPRRVPQFRGEIPALPPDGGYAAAQTEQLRSQARLTHHLGTGKPFKR